jgi:hypothetical protein
MRLDARGDGGKNSPTEGRLEIQEVIFANKPQALPTSSVKVDRTEYINHISSNAGVMTMRDIQRRLLAAAFIDTMYTRHRMKALIITECAH